MNLNPGDGNFDGGTDVLDRIIWSTNNFTFGTTFVTGDFNNLKNVMPKFAKGADALIATHAIPENARGNQRELHVLPSQLGRIAKQAEARMLILSHRMNRSKGRESQTRAHIEEEYDGYVLFANDMECWGL